MVTPFFNLVLQYFAPVTVDGSLQITPVLNVLLLMPPVVRLVSLSSSFQKAVHLTNCKTKHTVLRMICAIGKKCALTQQSLKVKTVELK